MDRAAGDGERRAGVQSVDRALEILDVLAFRGQGEKVQIFPAGRDPVAVGNLEIKHRGQFVVRPGQ